MRRFHGLILACGLVAASSTASSAQDLLIGDVAGYGPYGVSNGKGYGVRQPSPQVRLGTFRANLAERMNRLGMHGGYWTPLDYPPDSTTGPTAYYSPAWSGLNGIPAPDVSTRGWGYSPPWSAAYRQGEPKKHKLFSHFHHKD